MQGRFKISLDPSPYKCKVELDDKDISGMVRGITIHAEIGEVTSIQIECNPKLVDLEGLANYTLTSPLLMTPTLNDESES